ncbi:MAG: phosphate acyltransferase PlsX, partial [Candidatus Omnitrophica bacterium]|nr:phosphate acyltransferase PlsX [Candidatus Omnitrophota bacterium]
MKVAVDVMGSDKGVEQIIEGALLGARREKVDLALVGDRKKITTSFAGQFTGSSEVTIEDSNKIVPMGEKVSLSLLKDKDSSLSIALKLVKEERAEVVVSAGNTAAFVGLAIRQLGFLPGVDRPAIAVFLPTPKGFCIFLDVGAMVDPSPHNLLQYAVMGNVCSQILLKKENPTIGLLNIGEEETKGNSLSKETYRLLSSSFLNFKGNIEGQDIFSGDIDVVVTDGFVGNVVLKACEGMADLIRKMVKDSLSSHPLGRLRAILNRNLFQELEKKVSYAEYGGGMLLGVNGICIISHGRSPASAIANAVKVGKEAALAKVVP